VVLVCRFCFVGARGGKEEGRREGGKEGRKGGGEGGRGGKDGKREGEREGTRFIGWPCLQISREGASEGPDAASTRGPNAQRKPFIFEHLFPSSHLTPYNHRSFPALSPLCSWLPGFWTSEVHRGTGESLVWVLTAQYGQAIGGTAEWEGRRGEGKEGE